MASESAGAEPTKGANPTVWTAAIVVVLMGGLVGILAIVAHAYGKAEEAGAILGVVVPAVVSFGAAAFGAAVAYKAAGGKADAEAGKADAEAKQQSAEEEAQKVQAASRGTAVDAMSQLRTVEEALKHIVEPVTEASSTPVGERDLLLQPAGRTEPVKVRKDDIDKATNSIAAAQTNLQNLLRGVPE
jgi:hypothetical protein